MLNIPYQAVDKKEIRNDFLKYINALHIPCIDYIAIGIQNIETQHSYALKSDEQFQKAYTELELAKHDPLRRALWYGQHKYISFDALDYHDSMGKTVMKYREKFGINRGVVCMQSEGGYRYVLTLATDYSRFNGYQFLMENREGIKHCFRDLREIIETVKKEF